MDVSSVSDPSRQILIDVHVLSKMGYDQIEPGDMICTYEAVTTRPDLLGLRSLQRYAKLQDRPQLNKMFHFEIIVDKYARKGMCRIAHADGSTRKVTTQDEQFKDHHPGQAFIVFRAKNEAVRKEIVAIAKKTAAPHQGHQCTVFRISKNPFCNLFLQWEAFKFENFGHKISDHTLKDIARMVVDYENDGKFYKEHGFEPKTMSCPEYVANIVNVAVIRKLFGSFGTEKMQNRLERVDVIFQKLKTLHKKKRVDFLPFRFSRPAVTPASLVEFFLKNQILFETVGYMGHINEIWDGSILDILGNPIAVSPEFFSQQLIQDSFVKAGSEPCVAQDLSSYAAKIMKALGILSEDWKIYPKTLTDIDKMQALFSWLYAKATGLSPNSVAAMLSHSDHRTRLLAAQSAQIIDKYQTFCMRIQSFVKELSNKPPRDRLQAASCFRPVGSLPYHEKMKVLLVEKALIRSGALNRTDRTLKLSLNCLSRMRADADRIVSIADSAMHIGMIMRKTLILFPLHFGCLWTGRILHEVAAKKHATAHITQRALLILHERIRKNGHITIPATYKVRKGARPWLHYSIDRGKTWDQEPLVMDNGSWNAWVQIPDKTQFVYRVFSGPDNIQAPDPIGSNRLSQQQFVEVASCRACKLQ